MRRFAPAVLGLALLGCPPPPAPPPPPPPPTPTPPPAPVDPAPVVDGDITVAYENGLRIVVKRTPGAELAAMQLYIRGGAMTRKKDTAGVELMALRAAVQGGTKRLDKGAFSDKLSAMGADLGAGSRHAHSLIAAKTLRSEFAPTFALMAEAFLEPALPASEIELVRQRQLATIKRREVTPDGRLNMAVTKAMYAGHPYEVLPSGTVESVTPLDRQDLEKHLASLRVTSRLALFVVGDIDVAEVRKLVRAKFGALPRGDWEPTPVPRPVYEEPRLTVTPAELPTNYIEASFLGPSWGDDDFAASVLAMRILSRRVWDEVRTKRNLSYAPAAHYGWSGELPRGSLYVTAVKANETIRVMRAEVQSLQQHPVGPKELAGAKSVFVTGHLMGNESTDGQASWLAICDLVGGDFRLSRKLVDRVRAVTPKQIQDFANRRIKNLQTVVIGPATVDREAFGVPAEAGSGGT